MIALYKPTHLKAEMKLEQDYQTARSAALQAQRDGKLADYALLSREAEAIATQLEDGRESTLSSRH